MNQTDHHIDSSLGGDDHEHLNENHAEQIN